MKKLINDIVYDTETAKIIGEWDNGMNRYDRKFCKKTFYQNKSGDFFLLSAEGAELQNSKQNDICIEIIPLTINEAEKWARGKINYKRYLDFFEEHLIWDLYTITGREAGIVLFLNNGASAIILDWMRIKGIPRMDLLGITPMGLGESIYALEQERIDDIASYLKKFDTIELLYDANGDANDLHGKATVYDIAIHGNDELECIVIVPDAWF